MDIKIQDNRDFLIDNLKGVLIFFVVFAHYIGTGYVYKASPNPTFIGIYAAIYTFHMPLFMFLSGYVSKNADKMRETAFFRLYMPFFIFNGLLYGVLKGNYLFFFRPNSHLWYHFLNLVIIVA